jgi:cysteine desulfurase family protein
MNAGRVYLDNAATSWPKPEAVYRAVDEYQRSLGAPAGRSTYSQAVQVEQLVLQTRHSLARWIGTADARRVVFTFNGTDALNLAIHGLLRPGDHVVTTVVEHNSVLRPLRALEDAGTISVTRVGCNVQGIVNPRHMAEALHKNTRLVALCHASNVTGALQPAAEIGALARRHGAFFLLDAAQSLGHVAIDAKELAVDLLAAPGHKGLLGPLGTGFLYLREGVEDHLASFRQGGTGSQSEQDRQPATLPDKYESGNHNVPGLAGLGAALEFLQRRGLAALREHQQELTLQLLRGLEKIPGVRVFGPRDPKLQVGVVSCRIADLDPQEAAAALDSAFQIQVRSGLHCAPLMHQALGTLDSGGTVRFSFGPMNTHQQVEAALAAVRELANS